MTEPIDYYDDLFKEMAEQLLTNGPIKFGGAFVVVPPKEGGNPISTLILDSTQDPAQFWGLLKAKAEIALQELDAKQRNAQGFRR